MHIKLQYLIVENYRGQGKEKKKKKEGYELNPKSKTLTFQSTTCPKS